MPYSSDDLRRLVQDDHTAAVIRLEGELAHHIVEGADRTLEALIRRTLTAWTRAYGGPSHPAVAGDLLRRILAAARAAVRRTLDALAERAPGILRDGLGPALALGVAQGAEFVAAASGRRTRSAAVPAPSRALLTEADRIRDLVQERRDRALFLLHPDRVSRWSQVMAGLGTARGAGSFVRGHVAWVINSAVGDGLAVAARAAGTLRLWVSEADACVRCLAYTGRTARQDEAFPGGLSWDPRQRGPQTPGVTAPPLHGRCRCRTVPWSDRWLASGTPFPVALRREAERSVGFGRARPSESTAVRVRAARELLRTVDDLLPAVEETARQAVRTGRFPAAA
ncbi:hypothetical protein ACFXKY_07970 [Streptomyces canus]|uniref:hypothetical protein n=1 Tax=Streptomyces canus TaxID=58343 RepID=UPI0036A08DB2